MSKKRNKLKQILFLFFCLVLSSCSRGQQSSSSSSVQIIPEGILEIFSPQSGAYTNSQNLLVSGICVPGQSVIFSGDFFTWTACEEQKKGSVRFGTFQKRIQLSIGNGSKEIIITQSVSWGIQSVQNSIRVTLDTIPPRLSFNSPLNGASINEREVDLSGSCEEGVNIHFFGDIERISTVSCSNGIFKDSVTLNDGDGFKSVIATQIDDAGNVGQSNVDLRLDRVPPSLRFSSSLSGIVLDNRNINISGYCESSHLGVILSGNIEGTVTVSCLQGRFNTTITLTKGGGTKDIIATQYDIAGNKGRVSLSVNLDGMAAAPSGLSLYTPSVSPSNDSTPEILVSGVESNALVRLYSDNSCSISASSPVVVPQNELSVIIEANVLTVDGTAIYYARQTDNIGNDSDCSRVNISYTYDGTRPVPPSGLSLHNPSTSLGNDPTPEVLVSGVESLATVELYNDSSCLMSASSLASVTQSGSSVIVEANAFTSDGSIRYYARQIDAVGNPSSCSSTNVFYTYEGTVPTPPSGLSLHSPLMSPSNDPTPEILVSGVESLATVELYSDSSCLMSASSLASVTQSGSSVTVEANAFTSDGSITYYAHQTDTAGNLSDCSTATISYTYDGTIPTSPSGLALHSPSTSPSNDDSTPEILVSGVEPLSTVELYSDSFCQMSTSSPVSVSQGESSVIIEANAFTSDGSITYYARQTDTSGNLSNCSTATISYTYDGTIPTSPSGLALHSPSTSPSNDPTPEILVAEVESLATVELYSDSSCQVSTSSPVAVSQGESIVIIEANAFTNDGSITYYARQIDTAGNSSNCSTATISYTYDGTIPTSPSGLALHSPSTSPSNDDPTPKILVSGVEPLATIELYSDSSCQVSTSSPVSVLQSESSVIIEANAFTNDGSITYYARQIDTAGNSSNCSTATISYTYDGTIPTSPSGLALHSPSTNPSNSDPTPKILVSGVEPLATVELYSDSSCQVSTSSPVSVLQSESSVIIEANAFTNDGSITYYARQIDTAGNLSDCSTATISYTYDVTAPVSPSGLSLHSPSTSPSNDPSPEILVSGVEPLSTVELYSDSSCQVSASSPVSVLQGESSVIIEANAFVNNGSITYYARQTDIVEHNSPCSHSSITYQYTSIPLISRVSAINGSYSTGDTLTISVEFGRQITVDTSSGAPRLTLIIGSSTKNAIYQSGTGSHIINFTYNIESGDMDNNGINVVSPIDMNGGSIKGASSLNALLTFPSPQNLERVFVNFKEKIFSTYSSFALIRSGGSVVTWGWSPSGGDSRSVSSFLSNGVTEIFSTRFAFAALKDDGSVVTWGSSYSGGDSSSVASLLSSGVIKIFSTRSDFAALKSDSSSLK